MAGHGLYAGRWSQRWSCFSRCRSRRGHRQWLTTALRRGSVWARDMLGWWGREIGWYYKFGEKVKSNQKVGKGGKIMNNQEFLTWILVGLHIVDPYRSYSHSPYSLMRPKYQHWAFAQDVVIGSGGAMLKRFVQALHFAKRCKDMGSEPKIERHYQAIKICVCVWKLGILVCKVANFIGKLMYFSSGQWLWGAHPTEPGFCHLAGQFDTKSSMLSRKLP